MAAFRDWTMLRHIPKGSKILDVGCGGGRPILAQRGTVTGLEPIAELAETARGIYAQVVVAMPEPCRLPMVSLMSCDHGCHRARA